MNNYFIEKRLETPESEELLSGIIEGIVCPHLVTNKEEPTLREAKTFLWFYYDTHGRVGLRSKTSETYVGIEVKYQSGV
ncbi:MAG: hypothetical protein QXW18_06290 [Candidatus Bathyarchaeia archaeon]